MKAKLVKIPLGFTITQMETETFLKPVYLLRGGGGKQCQPPFINLELIQ